LIEFEKRAPPHRRHERNLRSEAPHRVRHNVARTVYGAPLAHRRALENVFDVLVQPRNDVRRNHPPDAARGSGAGVDRGLDRAGVAADENRNEPAPDLLFGDQPDAPI
jgi:hypothetical protein